MDSNYEDLILYFAEEIYNNADEQSKEMYKQQKKDMESLLDYIAKVLLGYTILDTILSLNSTEKIKLRKEFNTIINDISSGQFKQEKSIMQNIFELSVKDKYYSDAYVMDLGVNFKLKKLTDKQIKEVVDNTIKGELWSSRLWSNKKELEGVLKVEVERFLQGNTNANKIQKVVQDKFNQNAFNTRRLVQTEVARCQNQANDVFAKEHGIEKQMFTATLDGKTSDFCRSHDGKIYKIDDPDKVFLPHHPFERSCYINVPTNGWKPSSRKDNITKENISYKTYEKWLEEQDI
jgi:SPP1 gp7 family putative phage head morphogenesis protein